MPGSFLPDVLIKKTYHNPFYFWIRVTLGLIGSLLIWTGVYNLIDGYTVENTFARNVFVLLLGFAGLASTHTFYGLLFARF
jgi:hypothetical protein